MSEITLAPGRRLSELRQQMGLSQRRVAELSGLTHSAISTIEQDKVSPAVSTLQKLLKVYGLSLSEFFSEPVVDEVPKVEIEEHELIDIGGQGVTLRLIHNGNERRLLEGEITLNINGQSYHLHAGQSYVIDTGNPHSFTNSSSRRCCIISAHTPATF